MQAFGVRSASFFLSSLLALILVSLSCGTLRASGSGSPSWLNEGHLADVLLYHVLLDEARYGDAGLVLKRLLENGGGGSYILCLEAEYSFIMLANNRPGDWLERAGRATRRAMQIDEGYWRVLYNRARWLAFNNQSEEALDLSMRAVENSDAPDIVLSWAYGLANSLKARSACVRILELLQLRDVLEESELRALGMLYVLEERHDEAIQLLSRDDSGVASLLSIAVHYFREGPYALAGRYANALLTRVPDHSAGALISAHALLQEDNDTEALAVLMRWRDAGGLDADVLVVLAALHSSRSEWEQALSVLELASKTGPEKASLLISRGRALLKLGRAQEALPLLNRAFSLSASLRERAEILLLLGEAYLSQTDAGAGPVPENTDPKESGF
jgi:tetratricopeptide (TPR) repeat protein